MSSPIPFGSRRVAALSLVLVLSVVPLTLAFAQDAPTQQAATSFGTMQPIVVTPTLFPTPADEIGNSITVITGDEIERKQERTLPAALKDVPGLNVVQSGGPGGQSSVFIRGTNSNQTKVLVDGIDVSDPSTPTGAFDFSQIPTWDIERIEVLRGPQSGLYGSDAIGGVVNIVTKTGSGPMLANGMVEGGSFGTFNQAAGVSGSQGQANYDFNFVHLRTADLPVTPSELLAPGEARNDDFSSNKNYSGKVGINLTDNFNVGLIARYIDSSLRFTQDDTFPIPNQTQSTGLEHAFFTRGTGTLQSFDGMLENQFGVAFTHYTRSNVDPLAAFAGETQAESGDRTQLNWLGTLHLQGDRTVLMGLEDQTDKIVISSLTPSVRDRAGFAELHAPILPRLYGTASVRVDDNSSFGMVATWRTASTYFVPVTDTQLKASYGTGFKAPTLFQLFGGTSANPTLQPETSRGFDLGFEQPVFDNQLRFGSTYFHNNIHNLIDSGPSPLFQNLNIDSATTYGAESFISFDPNKNWQVRADYTYTMATTNSLVNGDIPGSTLLRRPKQKVSVEATWRPVDPLLLTATALWQSGWFDFTRDNPAVAAASTPGYAVINLTGEYRITSNATFFSRINNLLDRHYQEPLGFLQPGFTIISGIKLSWGGTPAESTN